MKLSHNLIINLFAATYILSGCTKEGQTIETKVPVEVVKTCRVVSTKSYAGGGNLMSETKYHYTGNYLDSTVTTDPNSSNYTKIYYTYQSPSVRTGRYNFSGTFSPGYFKEFLNEFGEIIEAINYDDQNQIINRYTKEISCQ